MLLLKRKGCDQYRSTAQKDAPIGSADFAGGDSKFGLFCNTVTLWCIAIPFGYLYAFIFKFPVLFVYFVLNLNELVRLPAVYWHDKKYGRVKNITYGGFENE